MDSSLTPSLFTLRSFEDYRSDIAPDHFAKSFHHHERTEFCDRHGRSESVCIHNIRRHHHSAGTNIAAHEKRNYVSLAWDAFTHGHAHYKTSLSCLPWPCQYRTTINLHSIVSERIILHTSIRQIASRYRKLRFVVLQRVSFKEQSKLTLHSGFTILHNR